MMVVRSVFLSAFAALLLAAPATGATISISGDTLTFTGGAGEDNWPVMQEGENGRLAIADDRPVSAPGQCVPPEDEFSNIDWECPMPARIVLDLGDGVDVNAFNSLPQLTSVSVSGGPGDDRLQLGDHDLDAIAAAHTLSGGEGADELIGSQGPDVIKGEGGNDKIRAFGGSDDIDGGDGDDDISGDRGPGAEVPQIGADRIEGGPGFDLFVDYWTGGSGPVAVTLDGQADDGRPGEGDNLTGLENFENPAVGTWTLSDGAERVTVFGHDSLVVVRGMGGDDHLRGHNGIEELDGGAGSDYLEGGYGNDTITGGPGPDTIIADDASFNCNFFEGCSEPFGNDTIHARDGEADSIDCGVGADTAIVDAVDTVAPNCETVDRPGNSGPGPSGQACAKTPKVRGLKLRKARKRAKKAGCTVKVKRVRSNRVKKGRVVRAKRKGTRVTLHVSRGR